jgi:Mrp family chromosome partitioning ATPase
LEKEKVSVTAFFKGRPQSEFAPEFDNQIEDGQSGVAPELYSLVQTGHSPQGTSIVQTFCDMIPRLRMSEYDYVIFDLPPVSETSGSLRLASQMERTLLIVESELTQKSKVERVRDLLSGTSTRMFAVLNKTQSYGPQVLTEQA